MLHLATFTSRATQIAGAITVISCAMFAARGASSMVASRVLPSTEGTHRVAAAPAPAPAKPRHDGEVTARNMFCASCGPDPASGMISRADFILPPAILIETSLGDDPRATVHVLGSEVQGSWGVNEAIPGLGRVHRIAPQWIEIATSGGQLGRLHLLDTASPGPGSARPVDPATADSPPDNPFGDRLVRLDPSTFAVDRALIREMFAGASPSVTGRLSPVVRDGKPVGFKVFGIRPRSIPFLLGLQNGDQLEAINGMSLTSADAMLGLYAQLNQLNVVEVSITRRGQPITRSLRLR